MADPLKLLKTSHPHLRNTLEGMTHHGQVNLSYYTDKRCHECKFWGRGKEIYNPPHPTNGTMLKEQPCQLATPFLEAPIGIPPTAYACKKFTRRAEKLPLRKSEGLKIRELRRLAKDIADKGRVPASYNYGVSWSTFKAFAYNEVESRNSTIMIIANAVRDILGRDDIPKFDLKELETPPEKPKASAQIHLDDYLVGGAADVSV